MAKVRFSHDDMSADAAAITNACRNASRAIGLQTRRLNGTSAKPRAGRHHALSAAAKEARAKAQRAAADRRKLEQESFVELAKIRRARRLAKEEEGERNRGPRKLRAAIEHDRRSKVTAGGGASLARSHERIEKVMVPLLPKASKLRETSLVFRIKSRSLGGTGLGRWRAGELARFGRYLVRLTGLEATPEACVFTNLTKERPGSDEFAREMVDLLTAYEAFEEAVSPTGMVHKSIILPLPHEVELEGRQAIAREVSKRLSARNIPHLIALHAPDPGGDDRNYHLHVLALLREVEKVDELEWEIASTKRRDVFHPAMLKAWRRYLVALFNRELERAMSRRSYTLDRATSPDAHRGRTKTADLRKAQADLERRLDHERRREVVARAVAKAAGQCAEIAERLEVVDLAVKAAMARTIADIRTSLETASVRVSEATASIKSTLTTDLVAMRAQLVGVQGSVVTHSERLTSMTAPHRAEAESEPKEWGRALLDAARAERQRQGEAERIRSDHEMPGGAEFSLSGGLNRLADAASSVSRAIKLGTSRIGEAVTSWRPEKDNEPGRELSPASEPVDVETGVTVPLTAFDTAYADLEETSRDVLAMALAHLRIALREERVRVRKTDKGWNVAACDEHVLEVVRDLAATGAGDRLLSKIASDEVAPPGWKLATIDKVAEIQADWFAYAPREMERVLDEQPVRARNLYIEQAIGQERGHGVDEESIDLLLRSMEPDRMTFCVSLKGIKAGERFELAAEHRQVREALERLANEPAGRCLLRLLARNDIVGDIPAFEHWSQARVVTESYHEDGAALSPSERIRLRDQQKEERVAARLKSRIVQPEPQPQPRSIRASPNIEPPFDPRDRGQER